MTVENIRREMGKLGDSQKATFLQRFFKTAPGEYGAGDLFRGIRVPVLRKLSREYQSITLPEAEQLLNSPFHEDRLLALLILVRLFSGGDGPTRSQIYETYLRHTKFINNWDLVDVSANHIIGAHLSDKSREPLYRLAASSDLWERRMAMMATFNFIKRGEFDDTLGVRRMLLNDSEDLIHKAVGWMLREVGKRDQKTEVRFLRVHYKQMPRVMLRYAVEKFPEAERKRYLEGELHSAAE